MRFGAILLSVVMAVDSSAAAATTLRLLPGDERIDPAALDSYTADYGYHRPQTTDPSLWTRVEWTVGPVAGQPTERRSALTTFGESGQTFVDASRFDAVTLELAALDVPTMLGDSLADIRVRIDGQRVVGEIRARNGDDVQALDTTLASPVFGVPDELLLATLPLSVGLTVTWPAYDPLGNEAVWRKARVVATDDVTVGGCSLRAWIVETDNSRLWVLDKAPYVYRREFRDPNGETIVVWDLLDGAMQEANNP